MTAVLRLLAKLKPNSGWAALPLLGRTGWKRVAESIGERAEPKEGQEEIYVGLEWVEVSFHA